MSYEQMTKEDLIKENINLCKQLTEYGQIKGRLKLKEEQYLSMIEDMTEFVTRESPDYKLRFVNNAYCRFMGMSREELMGLNDLTFAYEEDRKKIEKIVKSFSPENPVAYIVARWRKGNGEVAWIEWTGRGFFNEAGELIEYQAVGRDVTERKKVQEELRKAREQLEIKVKERTVELSEANSELTALNSYLSSILKNISEGVAVIDELGNVENLNRVYEKNFGEAFKEIEKDFKKSIVDEKYSPINKMLKEKKPFRDVEIISSTQKGDVHCLVSGTPIDDERDKINKGVIVFRPIQEVHKLVNRFSGAQARFHFKDIITNNKKMLKTLQMAQQAALHDGNVLIQGESGTGKELIAQAIHNQSNRRKEPFVAVNCGAIPRELIGSELFGYTEGAFTGAKKGGKPGKFELASGGTIFLDEIGDMPFEQQVALLRVIQEKNITRIGGNQVVPVDVRIICATHKNLIEGIKKGDFRQDLYYRLNVISIKIPPLRERYEDIPLLFKHFLEKVDNKWHEYIDPQIIEYLIKYNWPGNVRELQNVVERMIYVSNGCNLNVEHLPEHIYTNISSSPDEDVYFTLPKQQGFTIDEIRERNRKLIEENERDKILNLLDRYNGNVSRVAKELGVARSTLYRKMKACNIIE